MRPQEIETAIAYALDAHVTTQATFNARLAAANYVDPMPGKAQDRATLARWLLAAVKAAMGDAERSVGLRVAMEQLERESAT